VLVVAIQPAHAGFNPASRTKGIMEEWRKDLHRDLKDSRFAIRYYAARVSDKVEVWWVKLVGILK